MQQQRSSSFLPQQPMRQQVPQQPTQQQPTPQQHPPPQQPPPQQQQPEWFETTSYASGGYGGHGQQQQGYDAYGQHQAQHQAQHQGQYQGQYQGQHQHQGLQQHQGQHQAQPQQARGYEYDYGGQQAVYQPSAHKASSDYGAKNSPDDDDDMPLLEELGIDLPAILHRIKAILTFRYSNADASSLDLGGPIIFLALFASCHLLVGKLHFGYILGWTVVGSILLWFILSQMAASGDQQQFADDGDGNRNDLDLYSCCSIVGYSLLPLVVHAGLSLLFPRRSAMTYAVAVVAVAWATAAATQLFVMRGKEGLRGKQAVVAYPCFLQYMAFALLTLY